MAESDTPPQDEQEDDYTTDDTRTRWEGLNTILSLMIIASLIGIVTYVIVTGTAISVVGQAWFVLYATVVLMASTWAFGKETLDAVKKARGK